MISIYSSVIANNRKRKEFWKDPQRRKKAYCAVGVILVVIMIIVAIPVGVVLNEQKPQPTVVIRLSSYHVDTSETWIRTIIDKFNEEYSDKDIQVELVDEAEDSDLLM